MRPSMIAEVSTSMPERLQLARRPLALGAARRAGGGLAPSRGPLVVPRPPRRRIERVAARADDGEEVAEHERQRQQQVAPDVRQRPHGERRQRRGPEAEHEPYAADDELAGGTRLCCSFDPPDRPHQRPADDAADEQSGECAHRDRDAETAETQDRAVAARADDREQVPEHERER